ncbi:uncharacterized protein LOC120294330 [Eucalyptus grandis]|uniref:uncharacterized protein LOC120294330 n=1 Tax=Eucalyptus grandis TaxID=71139 RepID=UPI00192EFA4F|nr:uncharacterized protein LOC120294330 [Eucalyptus grandis]
MCRSDKTRSKQGSATGAGTKKTEELSFGPGQVPSAALTSASVVSKRLTFQTGKSLISSKAWQLSGYEVLFFIFQKRNATPARRPDQSNVELDEDVSSIQNIKMYTYKELVWQLKALVQTIKLEREVLDLFTRELLKTVP